MYQLKSDIDTIAAIATPVGTGGIGIIRVSGPEAFIIADKIVRLKNCLKPSSLKSFSLSYGWIISDGKIIDEILFALMRSPKSYTTQDMIEIHVHGGMVTVQLALKMVLGHGARLAMPGEFAKRAFLNGRIDLTQAQAVLDIINAKTESFARVSQQQLKGELSKELNAIRDTLMKVYTHIEAIINFPEDGIDEQRNNRIADDIKQARKRVHALLASAHHGRILKEGISIVLCGKPNAGKSSLLNVLLKVERAIVTPIAGTTRDALEETAQIQGIPIKLVDTAGILEPRDLIEEEAIKRSLMFIEGADVVMVVLDASRPLEDADRMLLEKVKGRPTIVVLNKSDLPQQLDETALAGHATVTMSALTKDGVGRLESAIMGLVLGGVPSHQDAVVLSNARHIESLELTDNLLTEAISMLTLKPVWEIIAQDIKDAVNHCDAITGRNIDQDLIDTIFSEFCIGK